MRSLVVMLAALTLLLGPDAATCRADERVDVTAMDGAQLIAELGGTRGPGVVFVPDGREDRQSGRAISDALVTRGFRVLRLDLRGHGESGGVGALDVADRDVEGAYRYLLGRKIRPVFLVAKGDTVEAVLRVASRVPTAGLVLVGASGAASDAVVPNVPVLRVDDVSSPESRDRVGAWLSATGAAPR